MSGGYGSQLKKFYKHRLFYKILTLIYPPMPTLNTIPKKDLIKTGKKYLGKTEQSLILDMGYLQVLGKFYGIQIYSISQRL